MNDRFFFLIILCWVRWSIVCCIVILIIWCGWWLWNNCGLSVISWGLIFWLGFYRGIYWLGFYRGKWLGCYWRLCFYIIVRLIGWGICIWVWVCFWFYWWGRGWNEYICVVGFVVWWGIFNWIFVFGGIIVLRLGIRIVCSWRFGVWVIF